MTDKKKAYQSLTKLTSDIKEAQDVPIFSEAQLRTFNSEYVDSLDDASAVLDETNRILVSRNVEE